MSENKIQFPKKGRNQNEVLNDLKSMRVKDVDWKNGRAFSYVYYAGDEISEFTKSCYLEYFSENALNPSAFPSLRRLEAETVKICADLMNGTDDASGSMTTGGTESILMAVKTARNWASQNKDIKGIPEIVIPATAHPAFQKGCYYLGVKAITVPVKDNFKADVQAMQKAITANTIMLVGSAPSYAQGVQDDIVELGDIAEKKNLLLHVDACIGGFMLPFLEKLGYPISTFDFRVPGVTSISADIHKYGFAAKGASVILYNTRALRRYQFYVYTDWTGGIYASPTMTGTRPGGAIAAAWGTLNHIGMDGYLKITEETMAVVDEIKNAVLKIDGIEVLGSPCMTLLALHSEDLDIYDVGDEMNLKGWFIDKQQNPSSIHLSINIVHKKIVKEFIADLEDAVKQAKKLTLTKISKNIQISATKGLQKILSDKQFEKLRKYMSGGDPVEGGRQAAMYGMMGSLKDNGKLDEIILEFIDDLNSLEE